MKNKKVTKQKRKISSRRSSQYTHRDSCGMSWRFNGSRPVSAFADKIMREYGM